MTTTNTSGSDLHVYEDRTDVEQGMTLGSENEDGWTKVVLHPPGGLNSMALVADVAALEPIRIEYLHRHGHTVLRLVGDLRRDTVAGVGRAITTALLEAGSVLFDLDGVQIDHASRSLVFTATLDQAGGARGARRAGVQRGRTGGDLPRRGGIRRHAGVDQRE